MNVPSEPGLPSNKFDTAAAQRLTEREWEAVECLIPELLTWIQDINWPVAGILVPFLVEAGPRIAPSIRPILSGDDPIWIYHILQSIVSQSPALATELHADLERLANDPTPDEALEGVADVAREILAARRILD